MYIDTTFPPDSSGAAARFRRMIDALPRLRIEAIVEALIASLDARDGDPDMEDSEAGQTAIDRCGRLLHLRTLSQHYPGFDDDGEDSDEDVCQAGDDGCAPFMSQFGPRWGSHVDDSDREPEWCGTFAFEVEAGTLAVSST